MIGNTPLKFVSSAKVLGIHIQQDLKWDVQIDHMYKNASRRLFMLRSLKRFGFNQTELITVYTGYLHPLLEYADSIWHSSITAKQSRMLESIQRRACRIILGLNYISYDNALSVCNLEALSARREAHCLKFARSLSKSKRTCTLLPPSRKEVHGRQLRNDNDLSLLPVRTQRFTRSPNPYYIQLLNSS